jgi:hypothetical protein
MQTVRDGWACGELDGGETHLGQWCEEEGCDRDGDQVLRGMRAEGTRWRSGVGPGQAHYARMERSYERVAERPFYPTDAKVGVGRLVGQTVAGRVDG